MTSRTPGIPLNPTESTVMALLLMGMSTLEICAETKLAQRTVNSNLRTISCKAGISGRLDRLRLGRVPVIVVGDTTYLIREGDAVRLTEHQRTFLDLLAKGLNRKQIAEIMKLSVRGAEYHREELCKRLCGSSSASSVQLLIAAIKLKAVTIL